VVVEIRPEHIVHIVTDNGANYKKACHRHGELYEHITWTPCLAHTVNLMLKDIAERYDHSGTNQAMQVNFVLVIQSWPVEYNDEKRHSFWDELHVSG
jgi:hypothetical protein